ncbi:hypothetical protein ZWY2020_048480 [Hordeum vulgare]|nr:hypothetical protein ZWY2020_048476 [Hordeum vulgare]KAI4974873.1 hypothetical protein ZWY2020_048480 [Hordeum vulgare]
MALHGDPTTPNFLMLPPSSVSRCSSDSTSLHLKEIVEQNAIVAAHLTAYFPTMPDLAIYSRYPSTVPSLASCWRPSSTSIADLGAIAAACPIL